MPFKNHTALSVCMTELYFELYADSITFEAAADKVGLEQFCYKVCQMVAGPG